MSIHEFSTYRLLSMSLFMKDRVRDNKEKIEPTRFELPFTLYKIFTCLAVAINVYFYF